MSNIPTSYMYYMYVMYMMLHVSDESLVSTHQAKITLHVSKLRINLKNRFAQKKALLKKFE